MDYASRNFLVAGQLRKLFQYPSHKLLYILTHCVIRQETRNKFHPATHWRFEDLGRHAKEGGSEE